MYKRPILRYHGGKWRLAKWIIGFIPEHKIYVEPFGGAASVLLQKPRSYMEIYNDLDRSVVNVFRVMQNPESASQLKRLLEFTPFAHEEFLLGYEETDNLIERARRTIIRSFMGWSTDSATRDKKTGFRSDFRLFGRNASIDFLNYTDAIGFFVERLRGVIIENEPALDLIDKTDSTKTLFYVDPPYMYHTRQAKCKGAYRHEMANEQHGELLKILTRLKGNVILSGYESELYNDILVGWEKHKIISKGQGQNGNKFHTEVLWLSFRARQLNLLEASDENIISNN